MNYCKAILFIIGYLTIIYIIGTAIGAKYSAPRRFIYGYLLNTFIVSAAGIITQMFAINWYIYYYFVLIVDLLMLIASIYKIRRDGIILFDGGFRSFVSNYWFLILVALIATSLVAIYNFELWDNNTTDDAYYLARMAYYPYIKNPYSIDPTTGFPSVHKIIDLRNFTSFEIEASVYIYFLKIYSTLFARGVMSFINYFIFSVSIYAFVEKVIEVSGLEVRRQNIQYYSIIMLLLCFETAQLAIHGIIDIRDGWMINHAMYFGASLIRSVGFIWLLIPVLEFEEDKKKSILLFVIMAFVLLAKSTVVIPIIAVVGIVGLAYHLILMKDKRILIYVVLLILFSFLLGNNWQNSLTNYTDGVYYNHLYDNLKSPIIIIFEVCILFIAFIRRKKYLKTNILFALICIMFIIPPLNNIIEKTSVYAFVDKRAVSAFTMLIVLYACILVLNEVFIYITSIFKNVLVRNIGFTLLSIIIALSSALTVDKSLNNIKQDLIVFKNNRYLAPSFIIDLADDLNDISKQTQKQLTILTPQFVSAQQDYHQRWYNRKKEIPNIALAGSIRQFAPTVRVPFARNGDDTLFEKYSAFLFYPNKKNFNTFIHVQRKSEVNCIVMWNKKGDRLLKDSGFKRYKNKVSSQYCILYIYYK